MAGGTAGEAAVPQRLQWSQGRLGVEAGFAGISFAVSPASVPLWQMTENGSTAEANTCTGATPHRAVCRAIAMIATMPKTCLTPVRMLASNEGSSRIYTPGPSINSRKNGPALVFLRPIRFHSDPCHLESSKDSMRLSRYFLPIL